MSKENVAIENSVTPLLDLLRDLVRYRGQAGAAKPGA